MFSLEVPSLIVVSILFHRLDSITIQRPRFKMSASAADT